MSGLCEFFNKTLSAYHPNQYIRDTLIDQLIDMLANRLADYMSNVDIRHMAENVIHDHFQEQKSQKIAKQIPDNPYPELAAFIVCDSARGKL